MFDVHKFIDCIHNNNSIWETSSKDYMDRNIKAQSWFKVGESVYEDWNELSNAEKDDRVKDMKNRWRHIRDGYVKFINFGKSGQPAKKRTFAYSESLSFLQVILKRKTSSNIEDNENEDKGNNSWLGKNEDTDSEEQSTSITADFGVNTLAKKKKVHLNPFKTALLECFDALGNENDIDPDKAFLLSILPDYKTLNNAKKLDFRIHVLNFFKNQSCHNEQSTHQAQVYNQNQYHS